MSSLYKSKSVTTSHLKIKIKILTSNGGLEVSSASCEEAGNHPSVPAAREEPKGRGNQQLCGACTGGRTAPRKPRPRRWRNRGVCESGPRHGGSGGPSARWEPLNCGDLGRLCADESEGNKLQKDPVTGGSQQQWDAPPQASPGSHSKCWRKTPLGFPQGKGPFEAPTSSLVLLATPGPPGESKTGLSQTDGGRGHPVSAPPAILSHLRRGGGNPRNTYDDYRHIGPLRVEI